MTLEVRSRSPAYTGTLSSGAADARATRDEDEDEEQAALSTARIRALDTQDPAPSAGYLPALYSATFARGRPFGDTAEA